MKKFVIALCFMLAQAPALAPAATMTCVNCSQFVQQILDSITFANELAVSVQQYEELLQQTADSTFMVASEIDRLKNLPENKLNKWNGTFERMAQNFADIAQRGGDSSALIDVFRAAYPDFDVLYGISKDEYGNPNAMQHRWAKRQTSLDEELNRAIGISGQTLRQAQDADHAAEFERDLDEWLKTKNETEIQQAANQINGAMLRDIRELKTLLAATLQLHATMAAEQQVKERETQLDWEQRTKTSEDNFYYDGKVRF